MRLLYFIVLLKTSLTSAQTLAAAVADYPQLADFAQLLLANPVAAAGLLTNFSSGVQQKTILVPSNNAFNNYRAMTGSSVGALSSSDIGNILNYHSLQGALGSSDLQAPEGLISSTALTNQTYANRELSSNGAELSQVVYIGSNTSSGARVKVRQAGGLQTTLSVESGEGAEVTLDPTTIGYWSGGNFYIVDGFLTLPTTQTNTMIAQGLSSMAMSLNRTNVAVGTNAAKGFTCLCPNNDAFLSMGNLATSSEDLTEGPGSLLATLTRHGMMGSFYTTNFTNGDLIYSQNGYPIRVTRQNGSIYLNDAQIVGTNFISSTGCVHALDRIMGFLDTTTNVTTPANASIYANASNIPSPVAQPTSGGVILPTPAASSSPTSSIVSGSAPTANSNGISAAAVLRVCDVVWYPGVVTFVTWNWFFF
ncbi:hypothetical protein MMC18_008629 [Xylographa bjoerkii]|nr:hypothetical protein [Xylographa bjoerkii]